MNARGCRNAGFVGIAASNVVHNYFAFLQNPCVICCLTLEQVQVQASNSFHHVAIAIFACVSSWLHSAAGYHTCNSAATQCSATLPYQFGKHVLTIGPPVLTIYMFAELATFGFILDMLAELATCGFNSGYAAVGNCMRMSCVQPRISQNAGNCLLFFVEVTHRRSSWTRT